MAHHPIHWGGGALTRLPPSNDSPIRRSDQRLAVRPGWFTTMAHYDVGLIVSKSNAKHCIEMGAPRICQRKLYRHHTYRTSVRLKMNSACERPLPNHTFWNARVRD